MLRENDRLHFMPVSDIALDRQAVSTEVRGEMVHGYYWPENDGAWVSFTNAAGLTTRKWVKATPNCLETFARILLREMVDDQYVPKAARTLMVWAPSGEGTDSESLGQRIAALDGVVTMEATSHSFTMEVQPDAVGSVSKSLGAMVELQTSGRVIVVQFVGAPRYKSFLSTEEA